jgi:hypothetical protein
VVTTPQPIATKRSTALPAPRAAGVLQSRGERTHRLGRRFERRGGQRIELHRQVDKSGLDVDWDLDADGAAGRREGEARRFAQRGQRGLGVADAERGLADRLQHLQLRRRFVNEAEVAVDVVGLDLPGEVQQRRAGGQRLDQRAGRIAGAGAGAGDAHAQGAGDAGIRIGHVAGAGLAARRHEADLAAPVERVEDGHVVDGDHAERGANAAALEEAGGEFTDGDAGGRGGGHAVFLEAAMPPGWGMCASSWLSPAAAWRTLGTSVSAWSGVICCAGTVMLMAAATSWRSLWTGAAMVVMPVSKPPWLMP